MVPLEVQSQAFKVSQDQQTGSANRIGRQALGMALLACDARNEGGAPCALQYQKIIRDLSIGGEREATRFFSKRIDCSCLKERYKHLKLQPRVDMCLHCKRIKERSELRVCSNCKIAAYCSEQCQRAAWPKHKVKCNLSEDELMQHYLSRK